MLNALIFYLCLSLKFWSDFNFLISTFFKIFSNNKIFLPEFIGNYNSEYFLTKDYFCCPLFLNFKLSSNPFCKQKLHEHAQISLQSISFYRNCTFMRDIYRCLSVKLTERKLNCTVLRGFRNVLKTFHGRLINNDFRRL